jgi:tetratricopeptide (TPR) repeat protein
MRRHVVVISAFALLLSGCFGPSSRFNSEMSSATDLLRSSVYNVNKEGDAETVKKNRLIAEEKVSKAIENFSEALRIYRENSYEMILNFDLEESVNSFYCNAYSIRGKAKYDTGKYSEAIKDFNKVTEDGCYNKLTKKLDDCNHVENCQRSYENAVWYRAMSMHALKKYQEAIKDYDWIISNGKSAYYLIMATENLGRCYYGLRDYKSAMNYFEKEHKKYPNNIHAAALLCEAKFYAWDALQSDEKPNAIVAFCGQVLQKDPDNKIAKKTINKLAASIKQKIDVLNDEESKRLIELEKNKKK